MIGNIWTFTTHNFTVRVDALEEDDWDLSWDDDGDARDGLESGRYVGFCARAQALDRQGRVLSCDYLGNCIYRSLEDFRTGGGYFPDMVRNVCREARETLHAHSNIYLRT